MADKMLFPATFDEFAEGYKITDSEQVYTNGTDLIPIFRVKQWLEDRHAAWKIEPVNEMTNPPFRKVVCSNCNKKAMTTFKFCPNCGIKMR
jgi:hypothetical protein